MMAETKRWIWPASGILTVVLILWGLWGEGTASKLFPEKEATPATTTISTSSPKPQVVGPGEEESKQRYDATLHRRGKPLPDPFHSEAIAKEREAKKEVPKESPSSAASLVVVPKENRKQNAYPVLQGVMQLGEKKRAVISWNGESYTAGEGEQVGIWTISAIQGKTVRLIGPPGTLELSTR